MGERTFTTSNSTGRIFPFPARSAEFDARAKKITITDDGKLSITLECDVEDEDTLEQVKNLLVTQRGPMSVSFTAVQGELNL